MIIPIRCFTCGKVLADKWRAYQQKCQEYENPGETSGKTSGKTSGENSGENSGEEPEDVRRRSTQKKLNKSKNFEPTYRGGILDDLGITKICCRRHMLGHVDCIDWI